MTGQGLNPSNSKSTAFMLTTKRGYEKPKFVIHGTEITLKDNIRYPRVVLDYRKHIEVASEKAIRTATALMRSMPNVGGQAPEKRKLLTIVVNAQLLYAAPIWYDVLRYERNKTKQASPQRKTALRVASAYRTASDAAKMVV